MSVEDRVLFTENVLVRKMCGNHRDCLLCQREEKTSERLKGCMF